MPPFAIDIDAIIDLEEPVANHGAVRSSDGGVDAMYEYVIGVVIYTNPPR